jgi:hypothetical protein
VLAALNLAYALEQRPAQGSGDGATGNMQPSGGSVDLEALTQRLDRALGADGQLL